MSPSSVEILGTGLFVLAILHTFSIKIFQNRALNFPEGSVGENVFHLLGEVEVVFGFWAAVLFVGMIAINGSDEAVRYLQNCSFTEPAFVFVIMVMASTKPILSLTRRGIDFAARFLPFSPQVAFLMVALGMAPLIGSLITEPGAMTVIALLLHDRLFTKSISDKFKYAALGTLFVNISIGGILTHFAAPPVLMVANTWNFDTPYMFGHFGWKAAIAVLLNMILLIASFRREINEMPALPARKEELPPPLWVTFVHLAFMGGVVINAHNMAVFMGLFLFFLGFTGVTKEFQEELTLRKGLLVGFFLAGLVVLGGLQSWWLAPLIQKLNSTTLYVSAIVLTAFNDNAAITYLGSRLPNVDEAFKYALVAGACVGGGLTVIANAPNPAGFSILQGSFGKAGISPLKLFKGALIPTLIAASCFWWLPSF